MGKSLCSLSLVQLTDNRPTTILQNMNKVLLILPMVVDLFSRTGLILQKRRERSDTTTKHRSCLVGGNSLRDVKHKGATASPVCGITPMCLATIRPLAIVCVSR